MPQDLRKVSCPHEAAVLAELGQHPITFSPGGRGSHCLSSS